VAFVLEENQLWLVVKALGSQPDTAKWGRSRAAPLLRNELREFTSRGAAISGRECYTTAGSAAALGHLGAMHKRGVGCKNGAAT
jgi:hypothetical protein